MTALLSVRGMSLTLASAQVLRGISFAIAAGEVLAVLGPNGAGKSSLLKCVNRIFPEAQGEISLDGAPLASFSQRQIAARIGYAPQSFTPVFSYTVRQFVELGLFGPSHQGWSKGSNGIEAVIESCGIQHLGARETGTLSGGELQLVLLAAALVGRPKLLLLDEPTTFLDPAFQLRVLSILRELKRRTADRTAVLMATHDINLALELSDRIVGLSKGQMLFDCTADELLSRNLLVSLYQTEFSQVVVPGRERGFIIPVE